MPIRPIIPYPNALLRTQALPVTDFGPVLRALTTDLLDTMRAAPGIGITGPHIGVLQRVVVLELSPSQGPRFYINPHLVWASPETARHPEGSISMPGISEDIERPARVRVQYQTLEGVEQTEEAEGLLAVCHQHEIDQLDGIFWLQRLSKLRRDRAVKRYEKMR